MEDLEKFKRRSGSLHMRLYYLPHCPVLVLFKSLSLMVISWGVSFGSEALRGVDCVVGWLMNI